MVKQAEMIDEEEHFIDIDEDYQEPIEFDQNETNKQNEKEFDAEQSDHHLTERTNHYDARKRDPKFALAEGSCLWELVSFGHIHAETSRNIMFRRCQYLISFSNITIPIGFTH